MHARTHHIPLGNRPDDLSRRHAFTLVEAIATIAILAVISTIASNLIFGAMRQYNEATLRAQLHADASAALQRIVTELQEIAPNPSSSPVAADITSYTATSIDFSNLTSRRVINYNSGTSTVTLAIAGGSAINLLPNCTAFSFAYYSKTNASVALASPVSNIHRIEITLTASKSGITETLRTRVFLRAMAAGTGAA